MPKSRLNYAALTEFSELLFQKDSVVDTLYFSQEKVRGTFPRALYFHIWF